MPPVTLPYLFSPANMTRAGAFLEAFRASPSSALVLSPDVPGASSGLAAAATVLGSAIRLKDDGGFVPVGWSLMACDPQEIARARKLFRFEDGIMPRLFGGQASFESRLGQFVSVKWEREEEVGLSVGWAWEGVMALQQAFLSTEDPRLTRMAYEIRFQQRMMASLRAFLNLSPGGLEPVVRGLGEVILQSGLVAQASPADFVTIFDRGETARWTPLRTDHLYGRFSQAPYVNVVGFATMKPGLMKGHEELEEEGVSVRVASPSLDTPLRLTEPLMRLWDFAQTRAMARTQVVVGGRPS